ncbi:LPXTG cell wall anchor domain-containing protein [Rothia sp. P5766]|uniref:LPXTG cell wall anchor domain-containing protein n=1 Tax=Rothia sp. P5766 TaxID=3402656 RepID=UPI003AE011EB
MPLQTSMRKLLAATVLGSTLVFSAPQALAIPPGGASANTPGTSSTVTPGSLRAGDTISFTVSGFPANEQVNVKIDNGDACPSDSPQGACVVHQLKTDSQGKASGSFVLSRELAPGQHTLRFLATEIIYNSDGQQNGTRGYSNQSPAFTIESGEQDSQGGSSGGQAAPGDKGQAGQGQNSGGQNQGQQNAGSNSGTSGTSQGRTDSGQTDGNGSGQEEVIYQDAEGNQISKEEYDALMKEQEQGQPSASASGSASASASSSASASPDPSASASSVAQDQPASQKQQEGSFPWIGIIGLSLAALAAGFVLWRRRQA